MRSDTLSDVTGDQREGETEFEPPQYRLYPAYELDLKFHERGNLKLKADTWKFNGTIIEILQLIRNHSLIHIQMLVFFLIQTWAPSGWTSGGNLCSLSDWKTAASSRAVDSAVTLLT